MCLISNVEHRFYEGQSNVASRLAWGLEPMTKLLHLNAGRLLSDGSLWANFLRFEPDIVQVFLRATPITLLLTRVVSLYSRASAIVFSALQPPKGLGHIAHLVKLYHPRLVLGLSEQTRDHGACETPIRPSTLGRAPYDGTRSAHGSRTERLMCHNKRRLL